ncbi:hypothetical protein ABGB12_12765 [Actinocorallia sp. B10E7]|uniref:hypothetical protein n=1 Tax=Actinocorallia sp. B10E7 TaxID=3153558 RepID=UPI00325D9B25
MTRSLEAEAIDDALDLFALLMATRLISPARRKASGDRLAMLPRQVVLTEGERPPSTPPTPSTSCASSTSPPPLRR